jgi:hypothetical protein
VQGEFGRRRAMTVLDGPDEEQRPAVGALSRPRLLPGDTPSRYDQESADLAGERTLEFFAGHL